MPSVSSENSRYNNAVVIMGLQSVAGLKMVCVCVWWGDEQEDSQP